MIQLPKTIPSDTRLLLEKQLLDLPFDRALEQLSPLVLRMFGAKDLLFFLRTKDWNGQRRRNNWASARSRDDNDVKEFVDAWFAEGIDRAIEKDLEVRTSCVSYSAFSWPYPRVAVRGGEDELKVPGEFALLLPVSSQHCVRRTNDPEFSGYYVMMFDAFPHLSDHIVQLITYLPQTLSDILLGFLREEGSADSRELSAFAHDIKRSLLFAEDQVRTLRTASPAETPELLNKVERTLKKMIHRASSIMLADRTQYGNLRISSLPINLNEIVAETVSNFQSQLDHSRAELRIELADDLPLSQIDPAIFPTVLENLIENSLKYSGSGAVIYLKTKGGEGTNVRLEVADEGPGIPEAEWGNVFLKHYRGKNSGAAEEGNGLGLYLVQKIVEAHGGRVFPQRPEEGKMSFVVELPAVSKEQEKA